jgi:hypothetical protein
MFEDGSPQRDLFEGSLPTLPTCAGHYQRDLVLMVLEGGREGAQRDRRRTSKTARK